jgi:hypothetical protein
MKVLIQIPDEKASFGLQVLQSLDFVNIVDENYHDSTEFDKKWNDPSNLTISEARILTKNKIRSFWKK